MKKIDKVTFAIEPDKKVKIAQIAALLSKEYGVTVSLSTVIHRALDEYFERNIDSVPAEVEDKPKEKSFEDFIAPRIAKHYKTDDEIAKEYLDI